MTTIAITGGIGSGKSTVARIVATMGFPVYDTDRAANKLMTSESDLRQRLVAAFGREVFCPDRTLNRQYLARMIFSDNESRQRLNAIVHPAVLDDMSRWAAAQKTECNFVETALPNTSGLRNAVHAVWHVDAPIALRIDRVVRRNGLTATQVEQRIAAQADEVAPQSGDTLLINDGHTPLLPQVINALRSLKPGHSPNAPQPIHHF